MTEADDLMVYIEGQWIQAQLVWKNVTQIFKTNGNPDGWKFETINREYVGLSMGGWKYVTADDKAERPPKVVTFPLGDIDKMRDKLLQQTLNVATVIDKNETLQPYSMIFENGVNETYAYQNSQEGLAVGTYLSDKFNNWLSTETIAGAGGVNELSRIVMQTDGGSGETYINVDQINIATKVQKLLNAVAVSGGGFWDYQDAVYGRGTSTMVFSPVYIGSLSKEMIFQEVTTLAATEEQAAGSIVGRGRFSEKHKGGSVVARFDEPGYVIGLAKLTPRIDYSQGNRFDGNLKNMNELFKPQLNRIGFQDGITDEQAFWDTEVDELGNVTYSSRGKMPAWIDYMTDYNETFGAFAERESMMYMTFNRRYEAQTNGKIKDLTTMIDPGKYNYIFSLTTIDAMNYLLQVRMEVRKRSLVSNKQMPQV